MLVGRALAGASSRGTDDLGGEADAELSALSAQAAGCVACRISDVRRNVVFGHGSSASRVVFVVDQPSYADDEAAVALSSEPAASLFATVLSAMGLQASDAYVTCAVKCRPRAGRSPFPDEAEACEGYLFQQIRMIAPDMICPLGNLGFRLVTGKPGSIGTLRGSSSQLTVGGKTIMVAPIYHPAAAATSPALTAQLLDDARELGRLLRAQSSHQSTGNNAIPLADKNLPVSPSQSTDKDGHEQLSFSTDADPLTGESA